MDKTKARARALSNAVATVLDEADKYRSRRSSDFSVAAPSSLSLGGESTTSSLMPPPSARGSKPEASESLASPQETEPSLPLLSSMRDSVPNFVTELTSSSAFWEH